ncbi:MAG: SH3 domain-containing protein, partial [Chloroflexia bacterium]|nr:SH3 domain-containing protein [Chloroflexia bacterium]
MLSAAVAPVAPGPISEARAQAGAATIVHSADGVLLRAEPEYGAEVLATMAEGTEVGLRTNVADTLYDPDGVTQWWPISTGGNDGWVAGFYLEIPGVSSAPDERAATDAPDAGVSLGGESSAPDEEQYLATWDLANAAAMVAEPDGVNLRQDPGSASPAVKALSYQTVVELRVDELDTVYAEGSRWWPVRSDGLIGWVSGDFLSPTESWSELGIADDVAVEDEAAVSEATSKIAGFFESGSYVVADTDDGSGVNIRADGAPDAERIGIVPEDDVVQVMEGPYDDPVGNPWYLITDGEVTGFVSGWYLSRADQPGEDLATTEIPSKVTVPGLASGAFDYPLASWVFTQSFGCSPYWFEPWDTAVGCNYHNGVDLAAPAFTPLLAADGGTIEYAGWCDCGLGYYVKIDHGNGFKTLYGHMAEPPWVAPGDSVAKGAVIGPVGS